MGILLARSFDESTTMAHLFNSNSGGSLTSVGRNSTNGLRFSSDSNGAVATITLPSAQATIYQAFAVKTAALPGSTFKVRIAAMRDVGSPQVTLWLNSDGTLSVYRGDTTALLGTTSQALLTGIFYHIEWKVVIAGGTSGSTIVRINEIERMNVSSINTQATGTASASEIFLAAQGNNSATNGVNYDYDDLVVGTSAFVGDVQVKTFLPTGVGTTNNWTPSAGTSATATDDTSPNDDTDYITSSTVSDLTLFTFDDLASTSVIKAVIPTPRAKKTDAGTGKLKSAVRHSGSNYLGAEVGPSNGAYEYFPDVMETNPGTSSAWTVTDFNAAEFGVQRTA